MPPPYTVTGCMAADGPALAYNNMSAFWTDPTWVLIWDKGQTREYIIEQSSRRLPLALLTDRAHKRHQKVVDSETGKVVGYCRWILPDRLAGEWLEAQTPAVSAEEEHEYSKSYASADWHHRREMDALDAPVTAIKNKLLGLKEYMELDYIAVHPDNKGRGIASLLVASGITQAERMGVDIFILAFKAGLGVYQRLGFTMLDQLVQDDSKYGGKGEYGTYFLERVVNQDLPK